MEKLHVSAYSGRLALSAIENQMRQAYAHAHSKTLEADQPPPRATKFPKNKEKMSE